MTVDKYKMPLYPAKTLDGKYRDDNTKVFHTIWKNAMEF